MLPGFDKTDGDEYPVWASTRDSTDGVYCGRQEGAPKSVVKNLPHSGLKAPGENVQEIKIVVKEKGGSAVSSCKWVATMHAAGFQADYVFRERTEMRRWRFGERLARLMGLRTSGPGGEDSEGCVRYADRGFLGRGMDRAHVFLVLRC